MTRKQLLKKAVAWHSCATRMFMCHMESWRLCSCRCRNAPDKELVRIAPCLMESRLNVASEFLSSIVWRSIDAFSEDTLIVLDELRKQEFAFIDQDEIVDAMLTLSTVPKHRFNANWLDNRLRGDSMPKRDALWSTYLHHAWERDGGPVHRLVDWASSIFPSSTIDREVVDLSLHCARVDADNSQSAFYVTGRPRHWCAY